MRQIVLATESRYKRELFNRLGLPHICVAAHVDETPQPNESPAALAERLAQTKARALEKDYPDALIIGCDQVAVSKGQHLGKPGGHAQAMQQLQTASGGHMDFLTCVALLDCRSGHMQWATEPTRVNFRTLTDDDIAAYLEAEQPFDCAGSFKSEGMGIKLFTGIHTRDPSALIGLPLIALSDLLLNAGVALFPRD